MGRRASVAGVVGDPDGAGGVLGRRRVGDAADHCRRLFVIDRGHLCVVDLGNGHRRFRFPSDTTGAFYLRNVPVPLSIAWFDAAGRFVSSTTMAPCPDQEGCPTYSPAGPYRYAVEVLEGRARAIGSGRGVGSACRRRLPSLRSGANGRRR